MSLKVFSHFSLYNSVLRAFKATLLREKLRDLGRVIQILHLKEIWWPLMSRSTFLFLINSGTMAIIMSLKPIFAHSFFFKEESEYWSSWKSLQTHTWPYDGRTNSSLDGGQMSRSYARWMRLSTHFSSSTLFSLFLPFGREKRCTRWKKCVIWARIHNLLERALRPWR